MQVAISVKDVADAAAVVLTNPKLHLGKIYHLTCKPFSNRNIEDAFGLVDVRTEQVRVTFEDTKVSLMGFGLPEWQADGLVELYRLIEAQAVSRCLALSCLVLAAMRGLGCMALLCAGSCQLPIA